MKKFPDQDRSPNIIDETYNSINGPILEKRQTHYIFPFDPRPGYDVISSEVFMEGSDEFIDTLGLVKTPGLLKDDDEDRL